MTDHELATLIRQHVSDEPTYGAAPEEVLRRGRQSVRRTRSMVALVGAAVVVLAGAVVVPQLRSDGPGAAQVVDPAIAASIADYDATTMPATMDARARAVLEGSLPDLGPAAFVAFDSQMQQLPERYWPRASGLMTRYGDDTSHRVVVTLSHARSEAEGDADRYCDNGVDAGYYLECTVDRTDDGDTVITTLLASRLVRRAGDGLQDWQDQFMAVTTDDLQTTAPDRLWFSRDVKVIKSETFVTYVGERVQAPDLATARQRLVVPPGDLAAIGLDPALVMPEPPPGENGCPQWTMPTMDVSCTGAG